MVRRLATSGAGVEVVVGKAGAGKTTALAATREVFESAGYVVSGTALSARAAEELEVSAGISSVTVARLLGELDDVTRFLGPRDVLVVDEAGMVGTRTIGRLVREVAASGAILILGRRPSAVGRDPGRGHVTRPGQPARGHRAQREPAPARSVGAPGPRRAPLAATWCKVSWPMTPMTASASRRPWPQRKSTWSSAGWRPKSPER